MRNGYQTQMYVVYVHLYKTLAFMHVHLNNNIYTCTYTHVVFLQINTEEGWSCVGGWGVREDLWEGEGIPESLVSKFSDDKSHLKGTNCYQSPLAYAKL